MTRTITSAVLAALLLSIAGPCMAYNMMKAEELKKRLETKEPTILVDIQPKNAYNEHHFYGSIRTFAYPAKTEMDTDSLVQAVRMYESTPGDVVIIGPRGGKAEERSLEFLITRGIPEEKLYILRGGLDAWPYRDMLLNLKGGCN